ncbi:MAG: PAS domain S-box protein, partial [Magnetococcales bacterium]|nr:PAS domain S-box protein [Magnetococcales bacterium]
MPVPGERQPVNPLVQWVTIGAVFSLFVIIGIHIYLEFQRTEQREIDRLLIQTKVVSENLIRQMESANLAMESIRKELPKWQKNNENKQYIYQLLKILCDAMPGIRTINILDANGIIIGSNRSEILNRDISYRDYYKTIRNSPDAKTLYVSPPFHSLLGSYVLNISRALLNEKGEFAGIISATLDPSYYQPLLESIHYAPDMWSAIAHWDGLVFLISPHRADVAGKNLDVKGSFYYQHKNSQRTTSIFKGKAYITGEERLLVHHKIYPSHLNMDKPLNVVVSRDPEAVFATWRKDSWMQGGLIGLIGILALNGLRLQRRRQVALEAFAAHHHHILDSAGEGIIGFDKNGTMVFLNQASQKWLGWTLEEAVGQDCSLLGENWSNVVKSTLQDGISRHVEHERFVRKDGAVLQITFSITPSGGEGFNGGVLVFSDTTARFATEMALRHSEERFRRMADSLPGVIYDYALHANGQGGFLYISGVCREMFEVEPYALIADMNLFWKMVHPQDVSRLK